MIARLRSVANDRSGNVATILALTAMPMLGAVGAGVDYYRIASAETQLQNAADTAAVSALAIQTPSADTRLAAARAIFLSNYSGSVAASFTGQGTSEVFSTDASIDLPMAMMSLFGVDRVTVSVSATAERAENGAAPCVLALNGSASGAVTISGNADFTADKCVVYSNSTDASGMRIMGSPTVAADGFCSAGGVQTNQTLKPAPKTGCKQLEDPFAAVPKPAAQACKANNLSVKPGSKQTLTPGTYCGGIDIRGEVVFEPGTYVIDGQLKINAQASVSGSDLLLYLKGNKAGFDINGGASLNLSAKFSGSQAGILIMQDATANPGAENKLNGNSSSTVVGAIYTPTQTVTVTGTGSFGDTSPYMPIVADKVTISGNADVRIEHAGLGSVIPLPNTAGGIRLTR